MGDGIGALLATLAQLTASSGVASFGGPLTSHAENQALYQPLREQILATITDHPKERIPGPNTSKYCGKLPAGSQTACETACDSSWRMGRLQSLTGDPLIEPPSFKLGSEKFPKIPSPASPPACYQLQAPTYPAETAAQVSSIETSEKLDPAILGDLLSCCQDGWWDGRDTFSALLKKAEATGGAAVACDRDVAMGKRDFGHECNGQQAHEKKFCMAPEDLKASYAKKLALANDEPLNCFAPCYAAGFDQAAAAGCERADAGQAPASSAPFWTKNISDGAIAPPTVAPTQAGDAQQ